MKNWSGLKEILIKKNISEEDQKSVFDFLSHFSFIKRQQFLGVFLGFPEKIELFIRLIKKKKESAKAPNAELSSEIFNLEDKEINSLINELK